MAKKKIAVLPFQNLNRNDVENDYFSDGLTEELIHALTSVNQLMVIAKSSVFSLKNTPLDYHEIAQQLNVDLLVEGSVRKSNNRIRIKVQLINPEVNTYLWSESYDRELKDIFAVQDDIAQRVTQKLELEVTGNFTSQNYTQNTEAYELLLKGTYFLKRDYQDTLRAADYFEQAIKADPNYAEAYAYLGETYIHLAAYGDTTISDGNTKALELANKALSINELEPRAYKVLAFVQLFYEWNWQKATDSYQKALQCGLTPDNDFIAYFYVFLEGRPDKAVQVAQEMVVRNPLHAESFWQLGLCEFFSKNFEGAIHAFDQAIELNASYSEAYYWKGNSLAFLKQFDDAEKAIHHALDLTQQEGPFTLGLYQILALKGDSEALLEKMDASQFADPADPAGVYALAGLNDLAFEYIQKSYESRSVMMMSLKHYWVWDNLRSDKRMNDWLNKMEFSHLDVELPVGTQPEFLPKKTKKKEKNTVEVANYQDIAEALENLMEEEELFLNPLLSLRELAEALEIHPNKLSWVINHSYSKNFNDFVNSYRLNYFQQEVVKPEHKKHTLLSVAFESGFNSKSVFNDYFKKHTGFTPRQWMKLH